MSLSYGMSQILGLLDVATLSPAGQSQDPHRPPPYLMFTTTSNTYIGTDVENTATMWGVAIWQQIVMEDTTTDYNNPTLCIDTAQIINQQVYGTAALPNPLPYPCSQLTSPKTAPISVPNDPDPPEVD
jgi:hypothetical protein